MYQQERLAWNAQDLFYFRHAPPLLSRTLNIESYPTKRPLPPFTKAKGWQCSVYYYWWRFLKENQDLRTGRYREDDGPQGRVYRDFRAIHQMNFPNWWISHGRDLFREPPTGGIQVVQGMPRPSDQSDRVLVSIPFNGDVERTLAELRSILTPAFKDMQMELGPSRAIYPVQVTTPLYALHRRHSLWRAHRDNPDLKLHEVALLAGISANGPVDDADVKRVLAATASRGIKEANFIIEQVGRGLFPITNAKQLLQAENNLPVDATVLEQSEAGSLTDKDMADWIDHIHADDPVRAARYIAQMTRIDDE